MLGPELTIYDILCLIHLIIMIGGMYLFYKEGVKHGEEKAKNKKRFKQYRLPEKQISMDHPSPIKLVHNKSSNRHTNNYRSSKARVRK